MASLRLYILLFLNICFYTSGAEAKAPSRPVQPYHYDYSRIQETDQAWKCWKEGYRPPPATSNKIHEQGNGTVAEIERILRFDQSNTVLFLFSSNSDNQNLHTTFTVERNKLVRLSLDNAGLERLELALLGRENDCRLADLSVPRNRLRDLPTGVERLTALRKLDYSYNLLEEFKLDRLSNAAGLKQLLLSHNRLERFVATEQVNLAALHKLDLSNNRLRALDASYWTMPQLETFHVDNNRHLTMIDGWTRAKFPLVKGFDPTGTNNWNQTWLKSVQ
ncbi:PH domain leucine-rich repeat-containing protein phosphatase 1 [Anopheles gambiae]|uniref:PH domain leucine-rich repeat-containing protein phosphatase 1 n=1 Tax=Anopheles gambiae TaxID=7165 RepID=UPI002AC8D4F5|nr:PH domain leucine-rich repeat-containing protein phosphatase 1 [Anopheles gambiae]